MSSIGFETPENVKVDYKIAGVGSRFLAWFMDMMFLALAAIFIILTSLFLMSFGVGDGLIESIFDSEFAKSFAYFQAALLLFLFTMGKFFYFGLCEMFMRGQTPGKRYAHIRIVKQGGFHLDGMSILIRTLFRVLDQLPPLWIVPLLTKNTQRLGDIVAGTIVVKEEAIEQDLLRERLLQYEPSNAKFRFSGAALAKARDVDIQAVHGLIERYHDIPLNVRARLLDQISGPLARRLGVPEPEQREQYDFLEDFLAAQYRRQYRQLG